MHTQHSAQQASADDDEDEKIYRWIEEAQVQWNVTERVIMKLVNENHCFPAHFAIFRATAFFMYDVFFCFKWCWTNDTHKTSDTKHHSYMKQYKTYHNSVLSPLLKLKSPPRFLLTRLLYCFSKLHYGKYLLKKKHT